MSKNSTFCTGNDMFRSQTIEELLKHYLDILTTNFYYKIAKMTFELCIDNNNIITPQTDNTSYQP